MELFLRLLLTLALGAAGGTAAKKLRVPAAYMVGALLVVMTVNLTTGLLHFPGRIRPVVQLLAGSMVGAQVSRDDIKELRVVFVPGLLMLVYFCVLMIANGVILWKFCGVDLVTALFGCAPGGLADMGLISADFGANTAFVTVMQLVRLISVLLTYPLIFRYLAKRGKIESHRYDRHPDGTGEEQQNTGLKGTFILIAAGTAGGILLYLTGFPAGAIVGAMFGSTAANIYFQHIRFDRRLRTLIQICAGAYIGTIVTRSDIALIASSYTAIIVMIINVLVLPFIFGFIIHRLTKLELGTSLFCATPGGLQEMALLAEDMGLDVPKISIVHTIRVVAALALFPALISFVLAVFS